MWIIVNTMQMLCKYVPECGKFKFRFLELSGIFFLNIFDPWLVDTSVWMHSTAVAPAGNLGYEPQPWGDLGATRTLSHCSQKDAWDVGDWVGVKHLLETVWEVGVTVESLWSVDRMVWMLSWLPPQWLAIYCIVYIYMFLSCDNTFFFFYQKKREKPPPKPNSSCSTEL